MKSPTIYTHYEDSENCHLTLSEYGGRSLTFDRVDDDAPVVMITTLRNERPFYRISLYQDDCYEFDVPNVRTALNILIGMGT